MKKLLVLAAAVLLVASSTFAWTSAELQQIEQAAKGGDLTAEQKQLLEAYVDDLYAGSIIDHSGGPDLFGYMFKDSDEPDGPTYGWIDFTGGEVSAIGDMTDDNHGGPYPIGFSFP